MVRAFVLACLLGLCCLAWGCSKIYTYRVSGTVRSAADGKPLAGALVELEEDGDIAFKAIATAANGTFTFERSLTHAAFVGSRPSWNLKITADGYADGIVDISSAIAQEPERPGTTVPVFVVVHMRSRSTRLGEVGSELE